MSISEKSCMPDREKGWGCPTVQSMLFKIQLQLTHELRINKNSNQYLVSECECISTRDKYGGEQRRNILYVSERMCEHLYACGRLQVCTQKNVETSKRDEDGRRLQSGTSSVIAPEAALSGTIPHRPPNATATAEMPVPQDIHHEMI